MKVNMQDENELSGVGVPGIEVMRRDGEGCPVI